MAPKNFNIDIPTFAQTQLTLLAAEQETEIAETTSLIASRTPAALQRAGVALTNLEVVSQRTGMGGRTVFELGPDVATSSSSASTAGVGELPEHGLRTGDIVLVAGQPAGSAKKREVRELEKNGVRGVVVKVGKSSVQVAVDSEGQEEAGLSGRVWIVKLADDVTYAR